MKNLIFWVVGSLSLAASSVQAAAGSVLSSPSATWLGLKVEGGAARDIFEHIQKSQSGHLEVTIAREVKDSIGQNILCNFDGKTVANAWCSGSLLSTDLSDVEAVSMFEKLPTYSAGFRYGERSQVWRSTFLCTKLSIRGTSSATDPSYQCDTDVAPNGELRAKQPAAIGVLN